MKVSVASLGKFHAFDLAEQLRQKRMLSKLYSGYPKGYIPEALRPYAVTFPWLAVPYMAAGRYRQEWLQRATHWASVRTFDRWLSKRIGSDGCDLLHAWSSYASETTEKCKSLGITTVCDRGSTHVAYQRKVLEQEYKKYGLTLPQKDLRLWIAEHAQYLHSTAITVPSRIAQASFKEYGYEPFCVPYGVDLDRFRWQKPKARTFRIVFVGALSIRKGIPLLIQALRQCRLPKLEVWLVGTVLNEVKPFLKNLPPHFKVLGPVPQDDLPALFASSSVLLLPSCEEGLALVLGQALACGLPVIATKETGVEELIVDGEHGIVIQKRTATAVREAVGWFHNALDTKATRHAIRVLRPQLSWSKYGNLMVEQYEHILHEVA